MRPRLSVERAARRLEGPLLFLRRTIEVGFNEAVEVAGTDGSVRLGRVAAVDEETVVIELLEGAAGLDIAGTTVRFVGEPLHFGLGPGVLGRIFDGVGRPRDGGAPPSVVRRLRIDGLALNPVARATPRDFIETGVTAIDLMNSLVRGQKLPLFSGGGLPHDRIAVAVARHARLRGGGGRENFAIVFAGIGVPHDTAEYFRRSLEESGALGRAVLFLNLAGDTSTQRLLTPRFALTAAEYLAFVEGRHVLVILTDMTAYCEALREVAGARGEVPARKGFPGYMYSDLASLYERAGCVRGQRGTLTQLPILTMPSDDISHPVPDLSGYITEGQIVLSRALDRAGVWPPVDVLPSLSRLMKAGTGKGFTDPDHPALASQLYASYARAAQARLLASVVGEDGLSETDRRYLRFGARFEHELIHQDAPRSLEQSMQCGWSLLADLPRSELNRLSDAQLAAHFGEAGATGEGGA
ncbi:V-type ATP synthase subunit B [Aromatoleum toluclasticum]|uniref:V-type ATP synthase subunit B n=1 Tax=Aromatoleum toluclasticum TaxID=92003 RepID=UPI001D17F2CC|nr:V-type ATP synthase subunit B [Aromatoleum toluclasticum]MCC4115959.1 V-type ATP synthase subunit B [Aromatoleum toluclasticum]